MTLPAAMPIRPGLRYATEPSPTLIRPIRHSRAHVIHLAAEFGNLARTGGLAEAVAGLAAEQARTDSPRPAVILPLYRGVRDSGSFEPMELSSAIAAPAGRVWRGVTRSGPGQADVFALEVPGFDRSGIYGEGGVDYLDNPRRFSGFVRSALRWLPWIAPAVRVLHLHDWHTSLAPAYLRTMFAGQRFYDPIATVLTVHNGAYQGRFSRQQVEGLDLPESLVASAPVDRQGSVAWLELGLRFADVVTTVSATHASELRTPLGGFGLDERFRALGDRLVGVPNGIDRANWDPARDGSLAQPFDANRPGARRACRAALDRLLGFPTDDGPIVALIARLVPQKGIELLADGELVERFPEARFVVVGDGQPDLAARLRALARRIGDRVKAPLAFDPVLERQVLAGADLLLVPSLYEPGGLIQLHGQRYGAVPIVRRVGGLGETVTDGQNGFVFDDYSVGSLGDALERALRLYHDPSEWKALVGRAMRQEVGWSGPAAQYREVYRAAFTQLGSRRSRG